MAMSADYGKKCTSYQNGSGEETRDAHPCSRLVCGFGMSLLMLLVLLPLLFPRVASAQDPGVVRIVTGTAGGGLDFAARLVAPGLAKGLGKTVIVENRTFAVAPQTVSSAAPDGNTLLFFGSPFWLAPFLRKVPYDPVKDFSPVTLLVTSPDILVVHPSVPANNVKALITLAKAKPGQLNYASSAIGAGSHLAGELFKSMADINLVHVPHKGVTAALTSMLGGDIHVMFATAGAVAPHIRSERLRGLAVGSTKRSPLVPNLPTMEAAGLPGFKSVGIYGIFGPANVPKNIIDRLSKAAASTVNQPDVKAKLLGSGVEAVGSTPRELGEAVADQMSQLGKLIKAVGIRAGR